MMGNHMGHPQRQAAGVLYQPEIGILVGGFNML
jgi:hypothetical protein